jgi:hypothetical protein
MIRGGAIVGLSLLSALLLSAFAAQSASAAAATNTTAVTCVEKGSGGFSDAHCDTTASPGNFGHEAIANGTKTTVDANNEKVTDSTKKIELAVLKGKVEMLNATVECGNVRSDTVKTTVENSELLKKHMIKGVAVIEYSVCTVVEPGKCKVTEPIIAEANFESVEGLKGPKGEEKAMGLEFKGAGMGETLATIEFTGELCLIKGAKAPLQGSLIGTSGPTTESAQNNKYSGATVVFNEKFEMEKLKLEGVAATLTSIVTPSMNNGKPIAATTVT